MLGIHVAVCQVSRRDLDALRSYSEKRKGGGGKKVPPHRLEGDREAYLPAGSKDVVKPALLFVILLDL